MKFRKVFWILIFFISVNCMKEQEKNTDFASAALDYFQKIAPTDDRLTKEKLGEVDSFYLRGVSIISDDKLGYLIIFPNLKDLKLTNTKITDEGIALIKNTKIEYLDIDATQISNKAIKVLLEWKHLKVLNISYTNIDDGALDDILKLNVSLIAAGTKLSKGAKEKIRKKMQFEDEEYEIQW